MPSFVFKIINTKIIKKNNRMHITLKIIYKDKV
jgi:hypothetical protein